MYRLQRTVFSLFAVLIAIGGSYTALGTFAQTDTNVAQPGGDLPGDPSLQLVQVATGLIDPINATNANDGSGRLFVVERIGRIRMIQDGHLLEEPFLDIADAVKIDFLEQGLLGLAFHPEYETNGRFFVYYSDYQTNGDQFLVEYTVSPDNPNAADPESAKVLLTIEDPYVNHNGGTIHFGPDGYLYLAVGDGGLAGDPYLRSQAVDDLLGNILRLDVDSEGPGAYGIPPTNPFAGAGVQESGVADAAAQDGSYHPAASPEIYAWGLRNPWQFSFDSVTGDLYIADVGQIAWEEINFVPAADVAAGGQNFGWDHMEASHCYPPDEGEACGTFGVLPVAEFAHGEAGCSITGIGVYRGSVSPSLDGIYLAVRGTLRRRVECHRCRSGRGWRALHDRLLLPVRPDLRSLRESDRDPLAARFGRPGARGRDHGDTAGDDARGEQ
jgi:glucose/arabinose dehydrogenase